MTNYFNDYGNVYCIKFKKRDGLKTEASTTTRIAFPVIAVSIDSTRVITSATAAVIAVIQFTPFLNTSNLYYICTRWNIS